MLDSIFDDMNRKNKKPKLLIALVYSLLFSALLLISIKMHPNAESMYASIAFLTWAIIVTIIFLHMEELKNEKEVSKNEKRRREQDEENWKKDTKFFKLQYEQLNAKLRNRYNLNIVAGSILITASMILFGTLIELQFNQKIDFGIEVLMITVIVVIYSIWFICFHLTHRRLHHLELERLRKMEKIGNFRLHSYVLNQIRDEKWWNYGRRPFWLYFFYILTVGSIIILLT